MLLASEKSIKFAIFKKYIQPMKKQNSIIFCLFMAFLTACTPSKKEPELDFAQTLHFSEDKCHFIAEEVDSVSYLPLQSTAKSVLSSIDKMYFRNGLIYIADKRNRKIVAFKTDGTVAFVIDRFGHGEGEYQDFGCFTVDEDYIYVIDNTRRAVLLYESRTGAYKDRKPLTVTAWDVEATANREFLLAFVPMKGGRLKEEQQPYHIFIADKDFRIRKGLLEYDETYSAPLGQPTFFTTDENHIYFSSLWFDGVTVFDIDNPEKYTHIAIEFENKLTAEERADHDRFILSTANYLVATPVFVQGYIAFLITGPEYSEPYLYDCRKNVFCRNNPDDCHNAFLGAIASHDGMFVSSISDYDSYAELVECGFRKAGQAIEEALKEGDTVLILYHMRP